MGIALFEDSHWQNFSPISLTRATFDIKIGARTLFEEHRAAPEVLLTREYLAGVTGAPGAHARLEHLQSAKRARRLIARDLSRKVGQIAHVAPHVIVGGILAQAPEGFGTSGPSYRWLPDSRILLPAEDGMCRHMLPL